MATSIKNRPIISILLFFLFFNALPVMSVDHSKIDSLNHLFKTSTGLKKIDVLNKLSIAYDTISYIKSLDYANQALELTRKYKSKGDIAVSLDRVGVVQYILSNYDKSINYFLESLKIREEIGDKKAISRSYNNIGDVYLYLADYHKALKYFQKGLDIAKGIGYKDFIYKISNNLGIAYMKLANYDKALEYYKKTLDNCLETNDPKVMGPCLNNVGMVYFYLEDYHKALEYYLKSAKIAEKIRDKWSISNVSRNIGEAYMKLQDYNNSLLYLHKGLEIAREIDSRYLIKDCDVTLSELFYAKGDYKKAYEYQKLYSDIKDSIFSEEIGKNVAEMDVKFQTFRREKEIEILKNENEINILKIKKQRIQRDSLIIGSLFIILLIIILYNRYLLKKKTNKQLEIAIKKISKSEAELKESNATKDKFFTIISHDLKGPFSSLLGFSDILATEAEKYNKDTIVEFSKIINTSAHHLFDLVQNLLLWAGSQSGKLRNNPEKINLRELCVKNISILKNNAEEKNIALNQEIPEDQYVYVDRNIASTVIRNLVSNAIKFTNSGGTVTITSVQKDNLIEISIIDTGIGISEENRKKLFRIDTHYSTEGTSAEKGTGLGLITCKEFIEKSGGKIWIEGEQGNGSTFKFTLPISD